MGLAQSRITAIEDSERRSAATLKTMRKVAAALDCDFVYALVPRVPLQKIAAARARVVAEKYLRDVHHTMQLENQAISPRAKQELLNRVMQELMENPRRLWSRDG